MHCGLHSYTKEHLSNTQTHTQNEEQSTESADSWTLYTVYSPKKWKLKWYRSIWIAQRVHGINITGLSCSWAAAGCENIFTLLSAKPYLFLLRVMTDWLAYNNNMAEINKNK